MKKFINTKTKKIIFNILISILINAFAIGLMLVLNRQYIHDENIFIFFILAILIIIIETKSIIYGLISSTILCLSFNFFLTDPQYTFVMNDLNYYISFAVFIAISLIFGSIVIQLQKKIQQSQENEKRINILFELSKKFLNCRGEEEIYSYIDDCLKNNLNYRYLINDINNNKTYGNITTLSNEANEANDFCINQFTIVGNNQAVYSSCEFIIFPIRSKSLKFGTIYIDLTKKQLNQSDFGFLKSIATEASVVLEREKAIEEQEKSEHKSQIEHFKSTILRSLSHDLKTPLTSIQSGSMFLKENLSSIDQQEQLELLDNIYNESIFLYSFVNNLLNISKIADKQSIVKQYESLYDIIENVKDYFSKLKFSQKILFPTIDESLLIYCNAQLIIQVFINLIDHGLKYTKENSEIHIDISTKGNRLLVEVKDNGGGISENKLKMLFNEEKTVNLKKDAYRSNGLGLFICKSIIEIHGGTIEAFNNDIGGATFKFYIELSKPTAN